LDEADVAAHKRRKDRDEDDARARGDAADKAAKEEIKTREVALAADEAAEKAHAEAQHQIDQSIYGAHLMSLADKEKADRNFEEKQDAREKARLESQRTEQKKYVDEHPYDIEAANKLLEIKGKIAALDARVQDRPDVEAAKELAAAYQILGVTTVPQLHKQLDSLAFAFQTVKKSAEQAGEALSEGDQAAIYEKMIELAHQLALANDERADAYVVAEANFKLYQENEKYRLEGLGMLYQSLQQDVFKMWDEWAQGFAKAISDGKKFGDTMWNVLKQIENQILSGIIGNAFHQMIAWLAKFLQDTKNPILLKIGGFLGGQEKDAKLISSLDALSAMIERWIEACQRQQGEEPVDLNAPDMKGRRPDIPGVESVKTAAAGPGVEAGASEAAGGMHATLDKNTSATTNQTKATIAATGAAVASVGALLANITGNKALAIVMESLSAALSVLTAIETFRAARSMIPIPGAQHGGAVLETGVATVHKGEVVANSEMMRNIGSSLAEAGAFNSGTDMGQTNAQLKTIGEQLSASSYGAQMGNTVSFDGAVFHGVPDQNYVGQIMNSAVRQLRNASRSWSFNPTGT
jgi:hypothetical protein